MQEGGNLGGRGNNNNNNNNNNTNKNKSPAMYDVADAKKGDDFAFDIDQRLLIDPRRVMIRKLLAEGSYCLVYEGLYESKPVALKIIQPMNASAVKLEHKERFQREVTLQSRVNHENVVKLIGACVDPALFIVTELMRGDTLQKYLLEIRPKRLDLSLSISFALDISRAMEHLHDNGIIHRDLKPSNLLLTEDKKRVKVGDFGLARLEIMDEMTCEAGTYRWMAPEVCSKEALGVGMKKHYDHRVDVYSFAIILWELLTNKPPFKGRESITAAFAALANNERPSLENLPKPMVPLLESCWAVDPKLRPEFVEITAYLEKFLQSLVAAAPGPTVMEIDELGSTSSSDGLMGSSRVRGTSDQKGKRPSFLACFNDCFTR